MDGGTSACNLCWTISSSSSGRSANVRKCWSHVEVPTWCQNLWCQNIDKKYHFLKKSKLQTFKKLKLSLFGLPDPILASATKKEKNVFFVCSLAPWRSCRREVGVLDRRGKCFYLLAPWFPPWRKYAIKKHFKEKVDLTQVWATLPLLSSCSCHQAG